MSSALINYAYTEKLSEPQSTRKTALIKKLAVLVEKRVGISSTSLLRGKLDRMYRDTNVVDLCQEITNLEYQAHHPAWKEIISKLTVHETYFFRDAEVLRNVIFPQLIQKALAQNRTTIRIWSAACSTGEEVYTLAMLLLDALLEAKLAYGSRESKIVPVAGWEPFILGTDVSQRVLHTAAKACYRNEPMGSFRKMWSDWLVGFDSVTGNSDIQENSDIRKPKEYITKFTHFEQHNLLEKSVQKTGFDLILCRNVLIYFADYNKHIV